MVHHPFLVLYYTMFQSLWQDAEQALSAKSNETALLQTGSDPLSWGVTKTGIGEYAENLRKRGFNASIVVAVVDSGVDANHPFLQGRLIDGYDYVEDDDAPQDEHGHGTHVTGTIVDCTPDMDVKVMPVRVLNAFGCGEYLTIANGIRYAADYGASVINLSLGCINHSYTIDDAVDYALAKNVTVIVAACNYNDDAEKCSHAHIEECITVAAVDDNLKRYGKSNYGKIVDIAAPGVDIESCFPDGKYGHDSGTSMATPHVSAAVALLMCEHGTEQTPFQISNLIRSAATAIPKDVDDYDWKKYEERYGNVSFLGAGFLNTLPFFKRTVSFDANGGTGHMEPLNVSREEKFTLTAHALSRTGYEFDHWNTKADASGTSYADGASLTVIEDTTLYAQWKPVEWTVTLDANDEGGQTRTVTVSIEKPFAWPDNPFSRTGYTLDGWNTKADGSGMPYAVDASLTITGNLTLYAQWRLLNPIPVKPISWGTMATHMDEYASLLQKRGLSTEVIVAVVGSGVDADHPFLQGRLVAGYDYIEYDETPQDEHGHSTHVAGIIADCTPNNVKIMPVRVLNAFASGRFSDIVSGIRYAVQHNANVICLPLTLQSHSATIEDAIQYAISRGVIVVVAAGNHDDDASEHCPAHIEDCITVAAVDTNLKRWGLSNYGEAVDIAAPGVDINSCLPNGEYATMSGTSMAMPYVAAAALLICEYGVDQTPAQVAERLKNAARALPEDTDDTEWQAYKQAGHSWSEFLGAGFLDMRPFVMRTLTFNANGGSDGLQEMSVDVEYGGNAIVSRGTGFAKSGYYLYEWNEKADGTGVSYRPGATITVTENMTLYAQWEYDVPILASWGSVETRLFDYASLLQERGNLPEVIVAVIDTGVDASHPFLSGRLVAGYDFVDNDDDPQDEHYHGTHLAGTIVECTSDNVKIMPVRVLGSSGSGTSVNVGLGIRYAADNGANVICLGLSGSHNDSKDSAIQYAISKGVTVVVNSGNNGMDTASRCPAHIEECIVVSAVDEDLKCPQSSNYGNSVDIAAPSEGISSTVTGGGYRELSGTSQAAYVSAAAALILSEKNDLTPQGVEDALKRAARDLGDPGWDQYYGAGFLDMTAFIEGDAWNTSLYAMLYSDGEMIFQKSNTPASARTLLHAYAISASSAQYAGWYAVRDQIKTVTFAEEIHPVSTALWFYGCENLTTINNPENLKIESVTNMSQMFSRCSSLMTLDLSAWDTGNVTNMRQMFFQCVSLKEICVSDAFNVSNVEESTDMFTGCTLLVGGNGTKYDSTRTNKEYACIDGGSSMPGYFTDKSHTRQKGDVNGDGVIDQLDVALIRSHIVGSYVLSDEEFYAADMNGDNDVDIGDVMALRQLVEV